MTKRRYTNLVCLRHPKYVGDDYIQHNCFNCVNIFTQVLRLKRSEAIAVKQMEQLK